MMHLNKTKWKIIEELSKGDKTHTSLAKTLGITMPSIHAQIKDLESEKLIRKAGKIKGKTRPYEEYTIGRGFVYVIKALPNQAEQRFLHEHEALDLGKMLSKEEILQKIGQNKKKIKSFGVKNLTLIGSYAHDEAKHESDIDFLVEFEKGRGLFDDYVHCLQFLRDLFGKEIDLGEKQLLREELKPNILGGKKIEAKL
jgi:uncharacterized protein